MISRRSSQSPGRELATIAWFAEARLGQRESFLRDDGEPWHFDGHTGYSGPCTCLTAFVVAVDEILYYVPSMTQEVQALLVLFQVWREQYDNNREVVLLGADDEPDYGWSQRIAVSCLARSCLEAGSDSDGPVMPLSFREFMLSGGGYQLDERGALRVPR